MSNVKKHVGRITNTDKRCVVLFMQIVDEHGNILDPDHALIVDTDSLPDRLHEPLMEIVESVEGQKTNVLGELLGRRASPDGGLDMFNTLHRRGYVQKVPVDHVVMYPKPNQKVPLRQILEEMGRLPKPEKNSNEPVDKFNRYEHNQDATDLESRQAVARNLLLEAVDLEAIAKGKRDEAKRICPEIFQESSDTATEEKAEKPQKKTRGTRKSKDAKAESNS